MLTKEEKRIATETFWLGFRDYMSKKRSVTGRRMNWLNYPSDVSFIHIRLQADEKSAKFMFDIQAKDAGIRSIFWEQLHELRVVLEKEMGTDGIWLQGAKSDVVPEFDRIYWELAPIDSRDVTNHQHIYAFFADRLIHFDAFYQEFKDILIHLAS